MTSAPSSGPEPSTTRTERGSAIKWLLAGASGFLGTALRVRLASEGQQVTRLVRRDPATSTEFSWDPASGELDPRALDGVDVVVSLGGVGIAQRPWTEARREVLLSSRIDTTATVARAVAACERPPVLITASGIARYGTESGAEPYTEDSPAASDFLAQVTASWEAAARPAEDAGARVVYLRTSPVLDRTGGAFIPMKLAWSAGLGATLGDGHQRMPMISLRDYLAVVSWAAATEHAVGPYNLTIPEPATNAEFTDALARAVHRPRLLKAPAFLVRGALGELALQLLGDVYVVPERLTADGFVFTDPDVEATVASAVGGN